MGDRPLIPRGPHQTEHRRGGDPLSDPHGELLLAGAGAGPVGPELHEHPEPRPGRQLALEQIDRGEAVRPAHQLLLGMRRQMRGQASQQRRIRARVRELHGGHALAQRQIRLPAGRDGDPGAARLELPTPQHRRHRGLPVRHQLEPALARPLGHDSQVVAHRRVIEHEQRGGEAAQRRLQRGDRPADEISGEGLVAALHGACGGGRDVLGHR